MGGRTVADALLSEGVYRNRFETGISNGALGGPREAWEDAMFGPAPAAERPKYGGLNLAHHLNGACVGFGSCHLRLRPAVLERATFVVGDSADEPTALAPIEAFEPIAAVPAMNHDLFTYVEAQVHGVLTFADVEAIVIDPSYDGTPTGDALLATAARYGCAAEWHDGHSIAVADIPGDHPWTEYCDARALTVERLDAATLGQLDTPEAKYLWRIVAMYG